MAWSSGHTHEATMTVPATTDGALTDYTLLLTEADFDAADHDALADAFSADDVECAEASDGSLQLNIDVIDVDTTADTFILRVGPVDTSASVDLSLYWRYGSTSVSQTGTAAYDANWDGYWPLVSASSLEDRTSNNRDGTVTSGTVANAAGKVGGGVDFDSGDNVELASDVWTDGYSELTVLIWGNADDFDEDSSPISAWSGAFLIQVNTSGTLVAAVKGIDAFDNINTPVASGGSVSANAWNQMGLVYDGDAGNLDSFLNGSVAASDSSPTGTIPSSNVACRMAWSADSKVWDGVLDEAQIHSVVRSDAWIATEYDRSNTLGQASTTQFSALANRRRRFFMAAGGAAA